MAKYVHADMPTLMKTGSYYLVHVTVTAPPPPAARGPARGLTAGPGLR